jgi:hypothetical protein
MPNTKKKYLDPKKIVDEYGTALNQLVETSSGC